MLLRFVKYWFYPQKNIILPARLKPILACTELVGQKTSRVSFVTRGLEWNENSLISAGYPTSDYAKQQINDLETLLCCEQT